MHLYQPENAICNVVEYCTITLSNVQKHSNKTSRIGRLLKGLHSNVAHGTIASLVNSKFVLIPRKWALKARIELY
jgi:hypothetical protein